MDHGLNNRQRIVAAMSVLGDGEEAAALAHFMCEGDASAHATLVGRYSREKDRELAMKRMVKNLTSLDSFSSLAEIHPAWILEKLKEEPPRIIGIILRFLPSNHVRYILKNLSPIICKQVPNMVESFSVHPDVLDTIRRKFEGNFLPMRISRLIGNPGFENLYYLKESELEDLFVELGLTELAIALSEMSPNVLKIIYNRLDIKEAKKLKARIDALPPEVAPEFVRQAKATFMKLESERVGSKQFLKTIGLGAFADAMDEDSVDLMRLILQRLDPKDGYKLKRLVDERRIRQNFVSSEQRREMVLGAVRFLAQEGRVDKVWLGEIEDGGDDIEKRPTESDPWEEETKTLHQLA